MKSEVKNKDVGGDKSPQKQLSRRPINGVPVIGFVFIALVMGLCLWAGRMSPVQAESSLPSRATPTPAPSAPATDDDDDDDDDTPQGAYIELYMPGGTWATVQWQDSAGRWHDVEGWRGSLDPTGTQHWWVDQKDFGKSLFRWQVMQGSGGSVIGVSQPFTLPIRPYQVVTVTVSP